MQQDLSVVSQHCMMIDDPPVVPQSELMREDAVNSFKEVGEGFILCELIRTVSFQHQWSHWNILCAFLLLNRSHNFFVLTLRWELFWSKNLEGSSNRQFVPRKYLISSVPITRDAGWMKPDKLLSPSTNRREWKGYILVICLALPAHRAVMEFI